MPPTTTGPAPSREPPRPGTPLTVWYGRAVSKSQITRPSSVLKPRRCPSTDPENTAPGIAVTAAGCAGLHTAFDPHGGGAAYHTFSPLAMRRAVSPPPCVGSGGNPTWMIVPGGAFLTRSETAAYTFCPSLAMPHCTPPLVPPLPTRVCHRISPLRSGSSAYTTPDFCPASKTSRPLSSFSSRTDEP